MQPNSRPDEILNALETLFAVMVEQQQTKVAKLAKALLPNCTWEEVMNPDSIPELHNDPYFNYEDGILAGTIAAQIAVRAELRKRTMPPPPESTASPGLADHDDLPSLGDA